MDFSATPSLVGYLFQCRYALLESLQRLRRSEQFSVSIETLDDVVFDGEGEAADILQTKHHISGTANLTDASPDLWKSIRIWCEGLTNGSIPEGSSFFLITTAESSEGGSAYYLKAGTSRDTRRAVERLNATVNSSTNKSNEAAYSAFRQLTPQQKLSLAEAVVILDSAPTITDLDAELKEVVFYAAPSRHLDSFLQRLEGWWLRRIIQHLMKSDSMPVLSEELDAETERLREQFKQDNLPIDDDIMSASVDASGYQDRMFVQQLRLIEVGNPRIFHAIRNFFRAFEQRSRWVREDLILQGDLSRYEDRLIEEWDLYFQQMHDQLGDTATEDAKRKAAETLYRWVETNSHPPIRQGVTEPAISRGSYQMLADRLKVGWHPEFLERLKHLLESAEVSD